MMPVNQPKAYWKRLLVRAGSPLGYTFTKVVIKPLSMAESSPIFTKKSRAYLSLLRFSRISDTAPLPSKSLEENNTISAINLLTEQRFNAQPLLPLIYKKAISTDLIDKISPKARVFLRHGAMTAVGKSLIHKSWLEKAAYLFYTNNIDVILLKGSAFAETIYPAGFPRVGVDIDILVRDRDFDAACRLLGMTLEPVLLSSQRIATHQNLFERVFSSKSGASLIVELHRGLTNPYIFNIEEARLWSASKAHPKAEYKGLHLLSIEDTLLHLAVHAFRDLDFLSHNLLDAHEFICQNGIDKARLMQRASDWGAKSVLYWLLNNAHHLMETPVADGILDNLEPPAIRKILQGSLLTAHSDMDGEKKHRHRVLQLVSQLLLPDSLFSGLRFQAHYFYTRFKDLTYHH